jgi:hypothetical protein
MPNVEAQPTFVGNPITFPHTRSCKVVGVEFQQALMNLLSALQALFVLLRIPDQGPLAQVEVAEPRKQFHRLIAKLTGLLQVRYSGRDFETLLTHRSAQGVSLGGIRILGQHLLRDTLSAVQIACRQRGPALGQERGVGD